MANSSKPSLIVIIPTPIWAALILAALYFVGTLLDWQSRAAIRRGRDSGHCPWACFLGVGHPDVSRRWHRGAAFLADQ